MIYIEILDRDKRIELFYMIYYNILRETLLFVKPKFIISCHSFPAYYKDQPLRDYDIGLIFRTRGKLVDLLFENLNNKGIRCRFNEPFDMSEGTCNAQDAMLSWNYPEVPEVIILNFRNDLCSYSKWRKEIANIISPIINSLSEPNK